jgi:hypothetical protein
MSLKITEATQELKEAAEIETEKIQEDRINWTNNAWFDSWEKVKAVSKKRWGHKKEYTGEQPSLFLLAHSKDEITGKPQLIDNVQKKIPLIRMTVNKIKPKKDDPEKDDPQDKKIIDVQSFFFFDEKFDKRYDGFQISSLALDFWLYRVISPVGKEYYIFSQMKLPNCSCTFKGMLVELDDFAEMSRSMKIKSLSRVFFLKEYEPSVKILSPEQIVNYAKEREIDEKAWKDFLDFHPLGSFNRFPSEVNLLRSAWILSGEVDGYPLHLSVMGNAGTKKSMGYIETLAYKFKESPDILEGGNSRIKGLTPSFKEKPANLGYLAKAERVGFIDEIGKMVEAETNKHEVKINNILGEANFLLDHKKRVVGSGNDNDCEVQATAKYLFVTNPVSNRHNINAHVGLIDPTFMSRCVWWIQDSDEQEFALSDSAVEKIPPTPRQEYITKKIEKNVVGLSMCWGKIDNRDEFLTLFDTCNSFVCEIEDSRIKKITDEITFMAREPMKSSVWKPRGLHHVKLLVDGLCKHRCLFKDYDSTFAPKQEDYEIAKLILNRMVNGWDTSLSLKESPGEYKLIPQKERI